jgi:hypothetical protein
MLKNSGKFRKKNGFFPKAPENIEKFKNIQIIHFQKNPVFGK